MAVSALKTVTNLAKRIRKANPGISWQSAVKKAGAEYRKKGSGSKVGAFKVIERGEARGTPVKKVLKINRNRAGQFKGYSIAGLRSELRKKIAFEIGALEGKKMDARTKREKAAIQKVITAKKSEYRKLL